MNRRPLIRYILSNLLFGLNGIIASQIALNSYEIVFLRTLIGTVVLAAVFALTGGRFTALKHARDLRYILLSGTAMGASWMFLYEAYRQIGVTMASLLYYSGPVLVMILAPLMFHEKLKAQKITGFVIVLAGVVLINGSSLGKVSGWGLLCGMLSAVTYCMMVTLNRKSEHITGMENTVIQLGAGFVVTTLFLLARHALPFRISGDDIIWILILGAVNTGLGCWMYFSSLSGIPVQTAALLGYLELFSAAVAAALLLHERMSPAQTAGAVLIIAGTLYGELAGHNRKEDMNL